VNELDGEENGSLVRDRLEVSRGDVVVVGIDLFSTCVLNDLQ
jgi:hypothetical protein